MTSTTINLDYAYELDLTLRRAGYYIRDIAVTVDGLPFNFSGGKVEVVIFRDSTCRSEVVSKSSDVDTDYVSITDNVIRISFFGDLTDINANKYFWVLRYTDSEDKPHYWLAASYKVFTGKPIGDAGSSSYTIEIPDAIGEITLELTTNLSYQLYYPEDILGTKNGVNVTFTLPRNYGTGKEIIFYNGNFLTRDVDYTRTGLSITMIIEAPASTSNFKSMGEVLA